MKTDKELIAEAKALCRKFVKKCETGRVRRKETYADCKAFLDNFKAAGIDSCYECGEKCSEIDGICLNENCKSFGKFGIF